MKKLLISALLALTAGCAWGQQYQRQQQKDEGQNVPLSQFENQRDQLFNFDWKFQLGNPEGAEKEDYNDASWRTLDLPHDFQFEQPWAEENGGARAFKPMCEGWYRKHFTADPSWQGREVLLDFGGIIYYGDVYVNGQKVASTEYGYVGFETEISKQLHWDADNVVAVYANTGKKNGSRWYTGGGIFRDVHLRLQNPSHIMRHGIFITTPSITDAEATVQVQVDVKGFKKQETLIRATILDPNGKEISTVEQKPWTLTKHQHDEVKLPLVTVANPQRWDLDTPNLYTARVELLCDSVVVDSRTETFGIRTLEYSPEFGFKLNGRKVWLQGMTNHHDLGALGAASFDRAIERQFQQMKAFGFNCIRCSHNPYSESLTRIADRMGILVVDELIDKWSDDEYWGGRRPFMQLWPTLIPEWITRDRNCPSVILWSLGNELQIRTGWSGYDTNDWGITTYNIFNQMVKRYDPTRKTTVAMFPARAGAIREEKEFRTYFAPPELAQATEVSSFNYQWDCYPKYFEYAPNMILFQSEATTNQLLAPFYGMDHKRTVGLAYWGAIEYWGESNKWPKKGWNYSYFSHTLEPYPQAYLIRSAFVPNEPVVRIGVMTGGESIDWNDVKVGQKTYTSFWNCKPNSKQQVATFTNAEEVELWANGQCIGRQKNDTTDGFKRNIITWQDVPYGEGGTLIAVAFNNGHEVARHKIETSGKAVSLRITAENPTDWKADGMDLQYLKIEAIDSKGRRVPDYTGKVSVTITGEGKLYALDNADHYTDELFTPDITAKNMKDGFLQCIVRSSRKAGNVTVKVNGESIKGATLKLKTISE